LGRPPTPDSDCDLGEAALLVPGLPYSEYVDLLDADSTWGDMYANCIAYGFRPRFIQEFGYAIFTAEVVDSLVSLLTSKKVLEAGCGTGWLAAELTKRGVDIVAADHIDYRKPPADHQQYNFRRVYQLDYHGDAVKLLPGEFDVVLIIWPNLDDSFAADVAKAMRPGQMMIYEGEGPYGATADDVFFEILESEFECLKSETDALNDNHRVFSSLHDYWQVVIKK
ncbi:hypothetical protein BVRB_018580, partial [Beta vulgaris subsp. vulgaris]